MKKSIILLAALLALAGCKTKQTTYCSCFEPNPTPILDSFGLTESYKLSIHPTTMKSHQYLRDEDDDNVFFDNYQSVVTFTNGLEEKAENGSKYEDTINLLKAINEEDFQNKNLLLTYQISLGSSGYDFRFDAAYLKENTLYMHAFKFDKNSYGAKGRSFTMDMVYVAGYIWLAKTVTFTESKVIWDQDERKPMIVELD